MQEFEKALLFAGIIFVVIYALYYFLFLKRKYNIYMNKSKRAKKNNKSLDFMEFTYLVSRFNLDKEKVNILYVFRWIAFLNAFIISFTGTLIYYVPGKLIWKYLLGFVVLFALIYALYEFLGRYLVRKGWSKNGIK